jgi:ABC-type dipeptide/oligopeptide/nickel transport system permease component
MLTYTLQRIGLSILICIISMTMLFGAIHVIPGDPATIMLGSRATPEMRERLNKEMGLDQPVPIQLAKFLGRVAQGDLGTDVWSQRICPTR